MKTKSHLISILLLATFAVCLRVHSAPGYAENEILVKWQDGPESYAAAVGNAQIGSTIKRNFNAIGWQHVKLPKGMTVSDGMQKYRALDTVLAVEPNGVVQSISPPLVSDQPTKEPAAEENQLTLLHLESVAPGLISNDPRFRDQWYLRKIGATNAWSVTTGSTNVVVAVLDRGVNYNHPDLAANMWRNPGETGLDANGNDKSTNGIDDDGDGYVDDVHGVDVVNGTGDPKDTGHFFIPDPPDHGTFVAGIIGAVGNNAIGIAGLNWSVQIMAIRFAGVDSKDYTPIGYWSDNLAAWDYILTMKRRGVNIRVTSNSYGDYFQSASIRDAIATAGRENILCVFSAGNQGVGIDERSRQPHGYNLPCVIGVAASTETDALPGEGWSNFGKSTIHLAAPGVNFTSTWGSGYTNGWSGTSMACPLVAGAAALLLAADPNLTVNELKAAILGSVDQPTALKGKLITNGRLNVARALEYLTNANPPAIVIDSSPAGQWTPTNEPVQVTFNRPMNRTTVESAFVINPAVNGTFEWAADNRSFAFHHDIPFNSTTNYTARILGTAQDEAGGTLDGNFNRTREGSPADDFTWTFRFPISNDDFANARMITGLSGSVQSSNRNATFELIEPNHLGDPTSMSSVWYRWTAPAPGGWATFDLTSGTAFDSLLAAYTGNSLDKLSLSAANDNYGTKPSSRITFSTTPGTTYSIVVAGKSGDATKRDVNINQSGPFALVWYPTPSPGFTGTQFSPLRGIPGAKVTLTGTNFTDAASVLFNGASASFTNAATNNVDLRVTAVVPPDATSGPITVMTPHGNVTSTASFQILPPALSIKFSLANGLEITWPATSSAFVLEASGDLTSGSWAPVTEDPLIANGQSKVTLAVPHGNRFYRLKKN